jgi:hypothetical protein
MSYVVTDQKKYGKIPIAISRKGIHVKGVLWKLSDPIQPTRFRQSPISNRNAPRQREIYRDDLGRYQRSRHTCLVGVLRQRDMRLYGRLANEMEAYLVTYKPPAKCDDWPPKFVMDTMATCIVNAMDSGKYLQVARTVTTRSLSQRVSGMPYRAIFVRD